MTQVAILVPILATSAVVLMILRKRFENSYRQAVRVRVRDQHTEKFREG